MKLDSKGFAMAMALSVFLSLSLTAAGAQVYKWKDVEGSVSYSDNPYTPKKEPTATRIEFRAPEASHEDIMGQETPPPAPVETASLAPDATKQDEITKAGVEVLEFKITPSASGRAIITSTVRNNMPYPAGGLRIDVVLYTKDRKRLPDIEIKYTEGKIRPDWLGQGETAQLSYETAVSPDEISGHNYQVVWASVAPAPPGATGESVREVVVDKKTGSAKEVKKGSSVPDANPDAKNGSM